MNTSKYPIYYQRISRNPVQALQVGPALANLTDIVDMLQQDPALKVAVTEQMAEPWRAMLEIKSDSISWPYKRQFTLKVGDWAVSGYLSRNLHIAPRTVYTIGSEALFQREFAATLEEATQCCADWEHQSHQLFPPTTLAATAFRFCPWCGTKRAEVVAEAVAADPHIIACFPVIESLEVPEPGTLDELAKHMNAKLDQAEGKVQGV